MARAPYAWYTAVSHDYMSRDYLLPGTTVRDRVGHIGATAERGLDEPGFGAKFEDYVARGWVSLSSPVWTNFGLTRGLPISCFGSCLSDDSMKAILETHAEIGMMSKYGGGTSVYMDPLRGRGAPIAGNGTSHGSVHFAELYDLLIRIVSQGSSRRGEAAAYWRIDHPDVPEALAIRSPGHAIQKLSYGLCVPDAWLEDMVAGDPAKRDLWARVLAARKATGYPYLFFVDAANRAAPPEYKAHGLTIKHSNLCVTGDQRVVSDRGLKTAKELYEEGGALGLFDNTRAVSASPMRLVERNVPVFKIVLANGMTHTVTAYHKVKVRTSPQGWPLKHGDVACADLKVGDLVAVQTRTGVFGPTQMPDEAFLLGMYHGDGTQTESMVAIDLWERDFDLVPEIEQKFAWVVEGRGLQSGTGHTENRVYETPKFVDCTVSQSTVKKKRLAGRALKKFGFAKGVIPDWVWTGDEATQWQYVRGLLYTDGTVTVGKSAGNPTQLSLASIDHAFLKKVQLIFANLGVTSVIHVLRLEGPQSLPDGKGGYKEYLSKTCWRLCVGNKNDAILIEKHTGFLTRKGITIEDREYRDNSKKHAAVVSVEPAGTEDVYCCTVGSDAHHWVCNGVVTHNCSEIALSNDDQNSFVCCLSSMNVLYYDEWKGTDAVAVVVRLLDAVMSEFITRARGKYGMERAVRFAEHQRALGIGQLGWHSYLQSRMVPIESPAAMALALEVSKTINDQAHAESARMARVYGEPGLLKGSGRRHATLTAVAPNKSSATILGQVSEGIGPFPDNYSVNDRQKLKYTHRNVHLTALLEEKGLNTEAVWDGILKRAGSVQHIDKLTAHEKAVFRTVAEISQGALVALAAQRQPHIDQGQSLNTWIDPRVPVKEVNALILDGWRKGLKSFYYQENWNAAQQLTRALTACQACDG